MQSVRTAGSAKEWEGSNRSLLTLGHFVSTTEECISQLIQFVGVGSDDKIVDIGSGDGAVLRTLALKTGCSGIGIECNPVRVAESLKYAKEENVHNRLSFWEGYALDFQPEDLSDVSLVCLSTPCVSPKIQTWWLCLDACWIAPGGRAEALGGRPQAL